MLGDHSVAVPPDSIPNSVVKRDNADGSVGLPHVRVGHRQAPIFIQGYALGIASVYTDTEKADIPDIGFFYACHLLVSWLEHLGVGRCCHTNALNYLP